MIHQEISTDAEFYSSYLEKGFASDNDDHIASADGSLSIVATTFPKQAADIYRNLANSSLVTSRQGAAKHLGALAATQPEKAATLWYRLLRDECVEVAREAYESFSDCCYDIEHGCGSDYGIIPLSRMLQARFSSDNFSEVA